MYAPRTRPRPRHHTLLIAASLAIACGSDPPEQQEEGSTTEAPADGSSSSGPMGATTSGSMTSTGQIETTTGVASTDEGSTGGSTDEGSTGGSTDEGSTGGSTDESGSTGDPMLPPPWLAHLALESGQLELYLIDIDTAATTHVCTVTIAATGMPYSDYAYSVTFTRDDRLMFSSSSHLWEVALPSCEATQVGSFGFGNVRGIAPDEAFGLFGVSSSADVLIRIDPNTGVGTEVGPLGNDWNTLGATWNEDTQEVWGLSGVDDSVYDLDTMTGMASLLQMLPFDFFQVGYEYHSLTGLTYACSDNAHLLRIELDGSITDLGDMGFADCINLGAPWSDAVMLPPM